MLSLYTYIYAKGDVVAPNPIDYNPQLKEILNSLNQVISGITQHDANTGESHTQIINKLSDLATIGEAVRTLAEKGAATQEQMLGMINQIAESMVLVRDSIKDFQNIAIDKIEILSGLLKSEFDETQIAISDLKTSVIDALSQKTKPLKDDTILVSTGTTGKSITVPKGAIEITGYAVGIPVDYVVVSEGERRKYHAGEQYLHDWVATGNTLYTSPEIIFEVPMNTTFRVSWRAENYLGKMIVTDLATGIPLENTLNPLDAIIPVPDILG